MTSVCKWILIYQLGQSRIRLWDFLILLPNLAFLIFLLVRYKRARLKLRAANYPIISAFYYLIWMCNLLNILRCIMYMVLNINNPIEDTIDKVLWLILRYFMLFTELSVLIFGVAFAHIDSNRSIRWVMFFSSTFSLIYSVFQSYLEFGEKLIQISLRTYLFSYFHSLNEPPNTLSAKNLSKIISYPQDSSDNDWDVLEPKIEFDIFHHGGPIFLLVTSICFFLMYIVIVLLPHTSLRSRLILPKKKSFYKYCSSLAILNATQLIGSVLVMLGLSPGLCLIDVTTFCYLIGLAPVMYLTFLRGIFRTFGGNFGYQIHQSNSNDTSSNLNDQILKISNSLSFPQNYESPIKSHTNIPTAASNQLYQQHHFLNDTNDIAANNIIKQSNTNTNNKVNSLSIDSNELPSSSSQFYYERPPNGWIELQTRRAKRKISKLMYKTSGVFKRPPPPPLVKSTRQPTTYAIRDDNIDPMANYHFNSYLEE